MPQSIADQGVEYQYTTEDRKPYVFTWTVRHMPSFHDLASKNRAGLGPQRQNSKEQLADDGKRVPDGQPKLKRRRTLKNLRESLAGLDISKKARQVVGKKRSRDEDDEDKLEQGLPRKAQAIAPAFWSRYQELRNEHNALEAMIEAATVAHAYDERNGFDCRLPPHVNEEALAALEGRTKMWDSDGWPGGDMDGVLRFLDSATLGRRTPPNDFSWAGNEANDFSLFVRAADNGWFGNGI